MTVRRVPGGQLAWARCLGACWRGAEHSGVCGVCIIWRHKESWQAMPEYYGLQAGPVPPVVTMLHIQRRGGGLEVSGQGYKEVGGQWRGPSTVGC